MITPPTCPPTHPALPGRAGGRAQAGAGGEDDGLPRVERLLLDIYSQISEPDGIYAVARSHSMLAQVGWGGRVVGG